MISKSYPQRIGKFVSERSINLYNYEITIRLGILIRKLIMGLDKENKKEFTG